MTCRKRETRSPRADARERRHPTYADDCPKCRRVTLHRTWDGSCKDCRPDAAPVGETYDLGAAVTTAGWDFGRFCAHFKLREDTAIDWLAAQDWPPAMVAMFKRVFR